MQSGWRMREIDEMDFIGFLKLRAWDAGREKKRKDPKRAYIDQVWPQLK